MKKRLSSWLMQAVTSTISTTMVLVLLGTVTLTILAAKALGDYVKENLVVTVILEDGTRKEDAKKTQAELQEKPYTCSIDYISPEQALKEQIESMGVEPTEFLGENPFSITLEMKMNADYTCNDSLIWISSELKAMPYVTDVIYQKDLMDSLNHNLKRVSVLLLAVALLLLVVSLVLINNTVRLSVFSHRFTIRTMKLVGARWRLIRRPFIKMACGIGVASAFLACGILFSFIKWAERYDAAIVKYITLTNMGITAAILLGTGLIITVVCTFMSVTSSLRKRGDEVY